MQRERARGANACEAGFERIEARASGRVVAASGRVDLGASQRDQREDVLLARALEQPAQRRVAPRIGAALDGMLPEQERDAPGRPAREAKAGEDGLRARPAQQRGEAEREIAGERGDDARRVRASARREALREAGAGEQREPLRRPRAAQQRLELGADALARDAREGVARSRQRRLERGVGLEAERRDEPRRAKGPERVFGEAVGRRAHRAQAAGGEVLATFPRIDERSGRRIERDRIHGEVAMREVGFEARSRAVRGDVDHPGLGRDRHRSVSDAGGDRARKEGEDGFGRRGGDEIEVVNRLPAQRVADAAADEMGLVPGAAKACGERADGGRQRAGEQLRIVGRTGKGHRDECTRPAPSAAELAARYKAGMNSLRFRAPGTTLSLTALLARAMPQADEGAIARAVRGGSVRVAGRVERDPASRVAPGARIAATGMPAAAVGQPDRPRVRLRGPDFVVVETRPPAIRAPAGAAASVPALRRAGEDALDAAAEPLLPVIEGDAAACSLSLFATSEAARARLLAALVRGGAREERALVEATLWRSGVLATGAKESASLGFEVVCERDGVAEVALAPGALAPGALRETLGRAGAAIVGDARFGGRLVAGGLRLWSVRLRIPEEGIDVECDAPEGVWPEEPVFAPSGRGGERAGEAASLVVSLATLRALARGHPWVLADGETGDAGAFRPGALVALRGPSGEPGGFARIEGEGALAARVWSRGDSPGASVEARVAAAIGRRRRLLAAAERDGATDAFRLVHGEADGLPGLAIDRLGPCLRVLVTSRACAQIVPRAIDATLRTLGGAMRADTPVVEVLHLREPPPGRLECVRLARGTLAPEATREGGCVVVRERGLLFEVDPGLSRPAHPSPGIGLYLDQRENRERLAHRARGGRWLNLFAHTGAFSAALLAAGAAEVVSVDLSAAWLRALDATLERNALDAARHRSVRGDSRRYFERLAGDERFDGIVLDPPTAAAAGRRFWSVRRDLEPLVESALGRLAPRGCLLVCRNDRAGSRTLEALVRRAASRAGVGLAELLAAPPGEDFPSLAGFPEGDPFEGVLAVRAAR